MFRMVLIFCEPLTSGEDDAVGRFGTQGKVNYFVDRKEGPEFELVPRVQLCTFQIDLSSDSLINGTRSRNRTFCVGD